MKRLLLILGVTVAASGVAAAPAVAGLAGNPSFSHQLPVRVPSQAQSPQLIDDRTAPTRSATPEPGDDRGGATRHPEPGDDRNSTTRQAEPGDDRSGATGQPEPGDDRGGVTQHAEPRDDHGNPTAHPAPGDDRGGRGGHGGGDG